MSREQTDYRPLGTGVVVVLFCIVIIVINKRQAGDVAAMAVLAIAVLWTAGYYARAGLRKNSRQARHRVDYEAEERGVWEPYTKADPAANVYRIGVRLIDPQHRDRGPLQSVEKGSCNLIGDEAEKERLETMVFQIAGAANATRS
jgi:hypothetical protein